MGALFKPGRGWYRRDPVRRWVAAGYLRYLRAIPSGSRGDRGLRRRCLDCGIRFLTVGRNRRRPGLRCPFGCRQLHRRSEAVKRSQDYYQSPEGRIKKKALNAQRSGRRPGVGVVPRDRAMPYSGRPPGAVLHQASTPQPPSSPPPQSSPSPLSSRTRAMETREVRPGTVAVDSVPTVTVTSGNPVAPSKSRGIIDVFPEVVDTLPLVRAILGALMPRSPACPAILQAMDQQWQWIIAWLRQLHFDWRGS